MYAATASLYQDQIVATSDPGQLVTMLYERVLVAFGRCRHAHDPQVVNHELQRAQDIISELTLTLDHDRGGEIARNLAALYDFCQDRLVRANLTKDLELLDAVEKVIAELLDAWQQVRGALVAG